MGRDEVRSVWSPYEAVKCTIRLSECRHCNDYLASCGPFVYVINRSVYVIEIQRDTYSELSVDVRACSSKFSLRILCKRVNILLITCHKITQDPFRHKARRLIVWAAYDP